MVAITSEALREFFKRLGEDLPQRARFYLLGGSALCLLGSVRETLDVDYQIENPTLQIADVMKRLAAELQLDLESVLLAEFIHLPPNVETRHRLFGKFGNMEVYIFDLYSIALSKIARGFESDLDDVEFLLRKNFIGWDELEGYFNTVLPHSTSADIDAREFQEYFNTLKQRMK